jgi:glycosyltransferase involved in cell wall biosynthesis
MIHEVEPRRVMQASRPQAKVPETKVPETKVPETKVPETKVPETKVPETKVNVLHVLCSDVVRGSQIHVKALRQVLDAPGCSHRLLTMFAGDYGLGPDFALRVPSGRLRAAGIDPRALFRLGQALDRLQPDVVVAHGGEPLKYLGILRGRRKLVYFGLGAVSPKAHRFPHRWLYTTLCRRSDLVVGISAEVAEECGRLLGVPQEHLAVAPNGRDPAVYHPADQAVPPLLLFVGHLYPQKRPDLFIEVVARLRDRGHEVQAAIVGAGPLEGALRAPAQAAGVELLGERQDVPELLGRAYALLFTSSWGEGMPGVLIEAGLSGAPVVSTAVMGVADVVDAGKTGIIVPPDDVDAMVEAVGALLTDPQRRDALGRAARQYCTQNFSLEVGAAVWRRLIEGLIGPPQA